MNSNIGSEGGPGMEPQNNDIQNYPYDNCYTTSGRYRPPKKPRKQNGILAVIAVVLLCMTAGLLAGKLLGISEPAEQHALQEATENTKVLRGETAETRESGDGSIQEAVATEISDKTQISATMWISEKPDEELTLQEIYKKVAPTVVSITAYDDGTRMTGTGIVMTENGYIITNYHVVSGADDVEVVTDEGQTFAASVIGGDEVSDLLVLKVDAGKLTAAEFGNSDEIEVGDSVVAIGDPFGVELRGTMTDGIVCGINRNVTVGQRTMTLIQTNAALNSGNSGGPLVNMYGQVIGINTAKLSSSYKQIDGIGFAIPIATAKPIVDELSKYGYVADRVSIGFTAETLNTRVVLFYNLPGHVVVDEVDQHSDAYRKGIRQGDIILSLNGEEVDAPEDLKLMLESLDDDCVTLIIYRGGIEYEVEVELMDGKDIARNQTADAAGE